MLIRPNHRDPDVADAIRAERRDEPRIFDDYSDPTTTSHERRYLAELASAAANNESKEQS